MIMGLFFVWERFWGHLGFTHHINMNDVPNRSFAF